MDDIYATGTDRRWTSKQGFMIGAVSGYWYIYHKSLQPNIIQSLYFAEILPETQSLGTFDEPFYWDELCSSELRTVTNSFNTNNYDDGKVWVYAYLKAGTTYEIGVTNPSNGDNNIVLYDFNGSLLMDGDENSRTINSISCSDSISYTVKSDGFYLIGAGGYSTGTGEAQIVINTAPELKIKPSSFEIYRLNWTKGGADKDKHVITDGHPAFIGSWTPSTETFDGNTIWTNDRTGARFQASFSGSSWRWFGYPNATSNSYVYLENNYGNFATPWNVTTQWGLNYTNKNFVHKVSEGRYTTGKLRMGV
jgi:hypothetical protein